MNQQKRSAYLEALGIQEWRSRVSSSGQAVELTEENILPQKVPAQAPISEVTSSVGNLDWERLEKHVSSCTACELHQCRTQTVFGVGHRKAQLLIIGEAPGANEDKQGLPFVGRAGQLLDSMLRAIGLSREEVYIANILKCRPPNNRDPKPEESIKCTPFLQRQIDLIKPKVILGVGRIAAHNLLNTTESLGKLRGREHQYSPHNIPMYITYHPAYLLRSPREKRKAYEDLLRVKERLEKETA